MKSKALDILTGIRWNDKMSREAERYKIWYEDRFNGVKLLPWGAVIAIKDGWITASVNEEGGLSSIPAHRLRRIEKDGVVLWSRRAK